jgi:hypothetical protein
MRRITRAWSTGGFALVLLAALGVANAGAAAPPWVVQATPNPVIPTGELFGVSCTSGTACTAVGFTSNSAGTDLPLAERWNGTAWSAQSIPSPSGAIYSFLSGVSCPSATACTAVGYYGNSTGTELPLAESWNGTAWALQSATTPSGATFTALMDVSCASSSSCTAVGNSGSKNGAEQTLAEAWNGTAWSVQTTATPSGASQSLLSSVSCVNATSCTAVGSYFNKSGTEFTLAEVRSGSTWSVSSTPNPTGAVFPELSGVSCTLNTACTAVGSYFNGNTQLSLAERWNGTSWTIQTTPNPAGASLTNLDSVSCISATSCTAVGTSKATLAEAWNGTNWSIQSTPNPANEQSNALLHVSCTAATGGCFGVGESTNSGGTPTVLSLGYYGSVYGWLVVSSPSPNGAATSVLSAVSCSASSACIGVGYSVGSSGRSTLLAEAWNGTAWSIQAPVLPVGAVASSLAGVSCLSATFCEAVGSYVTATNTTATLAEKWNGTTWSIQATPNPLGATVGEFTSVSCISSTGCTAVGDSVTTALQPLAEGWNGTSWSLQTTRVPSGATASTLSGVSCVAATGGCMAVGHFDNNTGHKLTLAEGYYGPVYGWLAVATPNPTGATTTLLTGVSCASGTVCVASGSSSNGAVTQTLAEGWNGSSFALQTTVNPSATLNGLNGISCTSATACTAVGLEINTSGITVTLAEGWTGSSWAVQTTPNPSIASASVLYGVSCTAATTCTAVGRYNNGVPLTLAEAN